MKEKDSEGRMVSYNPPRYKHHHNFYIKMQIRNNPYFDDIRFYINRGVVTLESVGGIGTVGGLFGSARRNIFAGSMANTVPGNSFTNTREQKRYSEYQQMCRIIEQTVEDGKRGERPAAQSNGADPIQLMLEQLRNAPDMETLTRLQMSIAMMTVNHPDKDMYHNQIVDATTEAQMRMDYLSAGLTPPATPVAPAEEAAGPKFCPNCGSPSEGGKFCTNCGSKLA